MAGGDPDGHGINATGRFDVLRGVADHVGGAGASSSPRIEPAPLDRPAGELDPVVGIGPIPAEGEEPIEPGAREPMRRCLRVPRSRFPRGVPLAEAQEELLGSREHLVRAGGLDLLGSRSR